MGNRNADAEDPLPSMPEGLWFGAVMLGMVIGGRQAESASWVPFILIAGAYTVGFAVTTRLLWLIWGLGWYIRHRPRTDR